MVNWIKNGIPFVYSDATWIESTLVNDSIFHFISRLSRACPVGSHKIDNWFLGSEDKCFRILSRINVDTHTHPRHTCPRLWCSRWHYKYVERSTFLLKSVRSIVANVNSRHSSSSFIRHQNVGKSLWFVFDFLKKVESFLLWRSVAPEGTKSSERRRRRATSMNRIFHLGAFNSTWSASKQMSIHFIVMRTTHRECTSTHSQPVIRHRVTNRV